PSSTSRMCGAALTLIALALGSGCSFSEAPVMPDGCTPGHASICSCPDGTASTQVCLASGLLAACECEGDTGAAGTLGLAGDGGDGPEAGTGGFVTAGSGGQAGSPVAG